MVRKACSFKEADVRRFVRAVTAAGLPVYGIAMDMMHYTLTAITDKDAVKKPGGKTITEEELKKLI